MVKMICDAELVGCGIMDGQFRIVWRELVRCGRLWTNGNLGRELVRCGKLWTNGNLGRELVRCEFGHTRIEGMNSRGVNIDIQGIRA